MGIEIKVKDVKIYYKSIKALDGVSLEVNSGEILSIVGPNGAGKSTLLKVISGVLKPKIGAVYFDGRLLREIPQKEVAMKTGLVPQRISSTGTLTVFDFVLTGRRPYINFMPTKIDEEKAYEALKKVNAAHLVNRTLEELSGGELQRVLIARALAVEPEVMLLDEPTSNLDLKYQQETLNLLKVLRSKGLTIIMTIHDLTQAYRISDKILMLKNGRVFATGKPEEVLTPQNILTVYGISTIILKEHKIITLAENI